MSLSPLNFLNLTILSVIQRRESTALFVTWLMFLQIHEEPLEEHFDTDQTQQELEEITSKEMSEGICLSKTLQLIYLIWEKNESAMCTCVNNNHDHECLEVLQEEKKMLISLGINTFKTS